MSPRLDDNPNDYDSHNHRKLQWDDINATDGRTRVSGRLEIKGQEENILVNVDSARETGTTERSYKIVGPPQEEQDESAGENGSFSKNTRGNQCPIFPYPLETNEETS